MENIAFNAYIEQLERLHSVANKYSNSDSVRYCGARNNKGQAHGYGKYTYDNGDVYEGEHQDDNKHGKGKYTWINGDVYEGEFKDDLQHGKGIFRELNGKFYEGIWEDGKNIRRFGGFVTIKISDECGDGSFEGEIKDGIPNGKGTALYTNGIKYIGDWKDGKRDGNGVMSFPDKPLVLNLFWKNKWKTEYIGEWKNGIPEGNGKYLFSNDDCFFEGELHNGCPHGLGVEHKSYSNGDYERYEGGFANGRYHGKGKYVNFGYEFGETHWSEGVFNDGDYLYGSGSTSMH